ncbi:MAG: Hpt domain-containing protein [Phycisphaerae bacterium]
MSEQPEPFAGGGDDPVFSSMLAECPELWDIVKRFSDALPSLVTDLEDALRAGSRERLVSLAERLKAAGESHGYAQLAERACAIEAAAQDGLLDGLERKITELSELTAQIKAGLRVEGA